MFNTDYTLDSFFDKNTHSLDVFCGNYYGSFSIFNINMKNGFTIGSQSIINTNVIQTFNSIDKIPISDNHYVAVSDEGLLYIIDKSNEVEKTMEIINEMSLLEELEDTNQSNNKDKNSSLNSNKNNKKKTNRYSNKFTPY
jgi:hypothetical protein